jgi:hypothetical protein
VNVVMKLEATSEQEAAKRLAMLQALPYEPLPPELEEEARAAFDDAERSIRAGEPGAPPAEIQALIARMKAEQGDDADLDP